MSYRLSASAAALALAFSSNTFAQTTSLDPVVVTANRQAMKVSEQLSDVTVLEREDIERTPTTSLGDLLARQPGVELASNGGPGTTSSIYMRGTNSGHTLVLIDGMRVGSATAGQMSAWSRIPVSQIERIEILRGPGSSLYGSDAIGGVIQIFTRRGEGEPHVYAEVGAGNYDTQSAATGFSGQSGGLRYSLSADYFHTSGINNITNRKSSSYNADLDGYKNHSFAGGLSYEMAPGHEVGTQFFYADGENQYDVGPSTATAAKDAVSQNALSNVGVYLKNKLTQNWTSTLRYGQSVDDTKSLTDRAQTSYFRTDQNQYSWQNDLNTSIGNFLLAAERLEQEVKTSSRYRVTSRKTDSLLAGWNGQFGNNRLQGNIRFDDSDQFGEKTTGSVAYGYQITKELRANVGYGTAFKAPSFNDLYYPQSGKYVGNPNLEPESSRNREASLHYDLGAHRLSATWFLNRVANLIVWPSTGTTIMPVNVSNARLEGTTLTYEGRISSFDFSANYTNLDARDANTGRVLPRRASNYGTVAVGQQIGAFDWRAEIFASDRRFSDDKNEVKLGGYALVNLYGAYRFAKDWSVFAKLNNLFDRDYQTVADYGTLGFNAFVGIRYNPK
ncbi:TonB-dependent receptor domain-containing protein [Azonexus sp. IMCC34839]|uniref:TonB-dependent receptor domain-containing protein n=1 Tax=Azonexus sp. IMCC34839 TaxID=3133695 RepID=UPI00399BEEC7